LSRWLLRRCGAQRYRRKPTELFPVASDAAVHPIATSCSAHHSATCRVVGMLRRAIDFDGSAAVVHTRRAMQTITTTEIIIV